MDWRLIKRSFTSSLDEEDRQVLEAWLDESERHRQLYEEMKRFVARRENFQLSVESKKRFKQDFELRIDKAYRRRGRRVWLKVVSCAAMLALPIIAGMLLWTRQPVVEVGDYGIGPIEHGVRKATLVLNDGKVLALDTSRMTLKEIDGVTIHTNDQALVYVDSLDNKDVNLQNRLITPKGGEYTIMLADGTKVWVNAATEIRYPVKFVGKERRVWLEGEAYFEVAHDTTRPFVVETEQAKVKVLGTSFDVSAYEEEGKTWTTLEEGMVEIESLDRGEKIRMVPGEQICLIEGKGMEKYKVETALFTSWRSGRLVFKDMRLEDLMRNMARWYDVKVEFYREEAKDIVFTGDVKKYEDLNEVLEIIELTSDVHFTIEEQRIIVH